MVFTHSLAVCLCRDRLCPSLDTLVPFDSEKPYDIKDVIFNVSLLEKGGGLLIL